VLYSPWSKCASVSAGGSALRTKGRRFTVEPLRKGKTPDVFFDKQTRSLAETEYMDQLQLDRKLQQMASPWPADKPSPRPFFPPRAPKSRCALGLVKRLHSLCSLQVQQSLHSRLGMNRAGKD
jgi:hypothetical protein